MANDPGFSVEVDTDGAVRVLRLAGELDVMSAPLLREQFRQPITELVVTIDMTDITFMDSSGIGALIVTRRQASADGWALTLRGVASNLAKVLQITGVDMVITIEQQPSAGGAE